MKLSSVSDRQQSQSHNSPSHHKFEFSFVNCNLMVPADHRFIFGQVVTTLSPRELTFMTPEPAIRDAVLATVPSLRGFAHLLCLNVEQAEHLVEETLARACVGIQSSYLSTNTRTWLFTLLRNHFYSEWRRSSESGRDHAETVESKSTRIAQTKCGEFYRAFSELRPTRREPLILIEAAGLTFEDAAQVCGCRAETMKSRVNRARTELAKLLAIEGPTDFAKKPVLVATSECGGR
jgi:RNA polymerase sigma-70 factor (ECF subfamily)